MSIPSRNSAPGRNVSRSARTFFATTRTIQGRRLFQSERNAVLLIDVLRNCVAKRRFELHDFVIMPDHVHLLLTVQPGMSIEMAMQYVKGGFSFRLKKEKGVLGEVWQRGYSEIRVNGGEEYEACRRYIAENPVKAGLAQDPDTYPYCFRHLVKASRAARAADV